MSSRIHAQLWATVVRCSVLGAVTRHRRSVGMFADVLDRFALGDDGLNQLLDDRHVVRVIGIGLEPFGVDEVRDQREVGVAVLDAEFATEPVGPDTGNLRAQHGAATTGSRSQAAPAARSRWEPTRPLTRSPLA